MSNLEMLTPQNSAIALIDYQPAMYQGVQSHDRLVTFNNVQVLAKAAKLFGIPSVISTIAKDSFSGPFMPEVTALFPEHEVIDRTAMNAWLDVNFHKTVQALGRKKIVMPGLWTEACVMFPTLDMLNEGFEIYIAADACGDAGNEAPVSARHPYGVAILGTNACPVVGDADGAQQLADDPAEPGENNGDCVRANP